jgi:hypothetical protein
MDGACLETYLSLCRRVVFGAPWDMIPAGPSAFFGPDDPTAALETLLENHSAEALLAAALAIRDVSGNLVIHPFLAKPRTPVVALRDVSTGALRNLMSSDGCPLTPEIPLLAALHDNETMMTMAATSRQLLVTGNLEDTILLRALGFAAAPIVGFSGLDDYALTVCGELFGWRLESTEREADPRYAEPLPYQAPGRQAGSRRIYGSPEDYPRPNVQHFGPNAPDSWQLVIVRWSLGALSPREPEAITRALQFLRDLSQYRGLNLCDIQVWAAAPQHIDAIRFALERREPTWVRDAVLGSYEAATRVVAATRSPPEPVNVASALKQLQSSYHADSGGKPSSQRQQEALGMYRNIFTTTVIEPLLRDAQQTADPVRRAMAMHFAALTAILDDQMCNCRVGQWRKERYCPDLMNLIDGTALSQVLALGGQFISLGKQLNSWTKHFGPLARSPHSQILSSRCAASASETRN